MLIEEIWALLGRRSFRDWDLHGGVRLFDDCRLVSQSQLSNWQAVRARALCFIPTPWNSIDLSKHVLTTTENFAAILSSNHSLELAFYLFRTEISFPKPHNNPLMKKKKFILIRNKSYKDNAICIKHQYKVRKMFAFIT